MDRNQNMVESEMSGDLDDLVDFLNLRVSTQTMGIGFNLSVLYCPKIQWHSCHTIADVSNDSLKVLETQACMECPCSVQLY
jgi:hypothetical protein